MRAGSSGSAGRTSCASVRSGPGELGRPLLQERVDPFREVRRGDGRLLELASSASCSSRPAVYAWSKSCFVRPIARVGRDAQFAASSATRASKLGRDHLGDEPPGERLRRGEPRVRAHPLERAGEPEQAVDEPRTPRVGHEPDPDEPRTNVAASDATRTSHAHANDRPAPAAGPLTAASTGFSSARTRRTFGW